METITLVLFIWTMLLTPQTYGDAAEHLDYWNLYCKNSGGVMEAVSGRLLMGDDPVPAITGICSAELKGV